MKMQLIKTWVIEKTVLRRNFFNATYLREREGAEAGRGQKEKGGTRKSPPTECGAGHKALPQASEIMT